jgi:hypothetical protein
MNPPKPCKSKPKPPMKTITAAGIREDQTDSGPSPGDGPLSAGARNIWIRNRTSRDYHDADRPKTKSPLVSGPSSNSAKSEKHLERAKGLEPSTPTLARSCSTTELHPRPKELATVTPTTGRAMPKAARECNSRRAVWSAN